MRAPLMSIIAIAVSATLIDSVASRTEEKPASRFHLIGVQDNDAPILKYVDQMPDGVALIDTYKAARVVADIEAANAKEKARSKKRSPSPPEFARLYAVSILTCEGVDGLHLDTTAVKARAFSATLARIDSELTKSLATMRRGLANERLVSTRAKDEVDR